MGKVHVSLLTLVQVLILLFVASAFAQETTGGLQGTVKDSAGAVVPGAHVTVSGTSLVGTKEANTDGSGYYRFANLPPGSYSVEVQAKGFTSAKRALTIEVGHLPTVDFSLQVGSTSTVVEVSGEAPAIDVTTTRTMTNVTQDVIQNVPHGYSFQSVIQFAPSARNEPLMGNTAMSNGSGGSSPGSTTNGEAFGFSVAGGSDSENGYLVEGQDTANSIGGYSHTNVPFDFIQEVEVKTSGVEAEHGGSLGGVVNVIMKKGSNAWHGSVFTSFENDAMDGSPTATSRYNPLDSGSAFEDGRPIDPQYQNYQPKKPHSSDVFPGFTIGGPLLKNRIFFFGSFNPELTQEERFVNFGSNGGVLPFSRNTQTYYSNARIDAAVSQKVRVFASWLYQYQRQSGEAMPSSDSTDGYYNVSSSIPAFAFAHNLGYAAPNTTTNLGADITLSPRLVSTTRFGYYFENYHDFGYPSNGNIYFFEANGVGASSVDGSPFPTDLEQPSGYFNVAQDQNYTVRNATKHIQFDQTFLLVKSGWLGTHNFKFGYQLNRLSNDIFQRYNEPAVQIFPGNQQFYFTAGDTGSMNCRALVAT